jgi:hypothetical protein
MGGAMAGGRGQAMQLVWRVDGPAAMTAQDPDRCASHGCPRILTGKGVIIDRDGRRYCKRHGDRLLPYLRKARPSKTRVSPPSPVMAGRVRTPHTGGNTMTTTETTTIAAKVTDYTLDEPVQPPDFWTVEVDGRELYVHTKYDEGELRLTSVSEPTGPPRFDFKDVELTEEQVGAVHAVIMAEIEGFNLPLLADIVRAIIRDTLSYRRNLKVGGVLDTGERSRSGTRLPGTTAKMQPGRS